MQNPKQDGFIFPAEYESHEGTFMLWPFRKDNWRDNATKAQEVFAKVINTIVQFEKVYLGIREIDLKYAKTMLDEKVELIPLDYDDAWARDIAPTFVKKDGKIRAVNWVFNAWGGHYDGLYENWDNDQALKKKLCKYLDVESYDLSDFILEGGAIATDGEGTILVTEACLLSEGRNPHLTKEQIEEYLYNYLGAKKIIWIPRGIYLDETNEHIDNICAFVKPQEVILAWCEDQSDPQYAYSKMALDILSREVDAKGRKLKVHLLPQPSPIYISKEESMGVTLKEGTIERNEGMRLAASYVNFYITNGAVIVPQFNDPNDQIALSIIQDLFKERKIIGIYTKEILLGGGNIHCITQQIPKRSLKCEK